MSSLPAEIRMIRDTARHIAKSLGLNPFEVIFEMIDYEQMCAIAARGGFPIRYPHWRFGMEYTHLSKSNEYGLSKIYEMVINTDPSIAYLLNANSLTAQKLVIAHVYAHTDFFKNNMWFAHTDRDMINIMANHATRVRNYMDKYGHDCVENFIDACLSLENLIDPFLPFKKHATPNAPLDDAENGESVEPTRFKSPQYMDKYVNPPELIEKERQAKTAELKAQKSRVPQRPERDVLGFLMTHAPLEEWQQDILAIIRDESYYFYPQMQTKIMNEGWAVFWHSHIVTRHLLESDECIDYADQHAATLVQPPDGSINPYKLGVELFRDIEDRWNRGAFGPEYEACESLEDKLRWNKKLGKGREKIFEVRKTCNDITFINNYLTETFCRKHKLFLFSKNTQGHPPEIVSRAFNDIKNQILFSLTNAGQPVIDVIDANFENRGELMLSHRFENHTLDIKKAEDVLHNLCTIWTRPVHLVTMIDGNDVTLTHTGEEFKQRGLSEKPAE